MEIIFLGVLFCGGTYALGWFAISPMGVVTRTKVKVFQFQLLDLIWLVLLLQPSLALFGGVVRSRTFRGNELVWSAIFGLIWGLTITAWYVMTGALSKAGVTHIGKRAAGVLFVLPVICVAVPAGAIAHISLIVDFIESPDRSFSARAVAVSAGVECAFILTLLGCRFVSKWITKGVLPDANSTR